MDSHGLITWWTGNSVSNVFSNEYIERSQQIVQSKGEIKGLNEKARNHLAKRLTTDESKQLDTFRFETDVIDGFKRIHTLFRRIAKLLWKGIRIVIL